MPLTLQSILPNHTIGIQRNYLRVISLLSESYFFRKALPTEQMQFIFILNSRSRSYILVCVTLCRPETPKQVLLQTAKTQMKCSMMWLFIRVCTVCQEKIDPQRKKYNLSYDVESGSDIKPCIEIYKPLVVYRLR